MNDFINYGRYLLACIGTILNVFLGGWDTTLQVLICFIVLDYLTGLLAAYFKRELSSDVGRKGIAKKVLILVMVGLAAMIDRTGVVGEPVFRTLACWFYIGNEGLSITENAAYLGLPIPDPLKEAMANIRGKGDSGKQNGKAGT